MALSTYGDISQRTGVWAMRKFLAHVEPVIVTQKFGEHRPIPRNKAQTAKFRRSIPYAAAETPLTEGVTPSSKKIKYEDVQVVLAQYGDWAELTDVVADQAEDPVLSNMLELAAEQAAETTEKIVIGKIKAGTSVIYTNGSARNAVNSVVDEEDIRSAVRFLANQRARRITTMLDSSVDIGTKAVEPAFIAFGHTDLEYDIRKLPGFLPCADYGTKQQVCPEELGQVPNCRFILSPFIEPWVDAGGAHGGVVKTTSGTSGDVYPLIVVGKESYGLTPLKGKEAVQPMVLNPNTARGGDPLGQRGSVAWKTYFAALILNDLWMVRIEVGASVLKAVA